MPMIGLGSGKNCRGDKVALVRIAAPLGNTADLQNRSTSEKEV
jgi:hypothetical protein